MIKKFTLSLIILFIFPLINYAQVNVNEKKGLLKIIDDYGVYSMLSIILLLCLSAVFWIILLELNSTLKNFKILPRRLIDTVQSSLAEGDLSEAILVCQEINCPLSRCLLTAFANCTESFDVITTLVRSRLDVEIENIMQHVSYLKTVAVTTIITGISGAALALESVLTSDEKVISSNHYAIVLYPLIYGLIIGAGFYLFYVTMHNRAKNRLMRMRGQAYFIIKDLKDVEIVNNIDHFDYENDEF
ncbi:hypothetical protein AAEX28_00455 [Lentisphaerota bacterium WC36G]|nr:hypothetical protein LJT99_03335 [Lentisphaerae bacterium WC36]